MAAAPRLTSNSDETEVDGLLSGDNIFSIPYFQRAYKWKPAKLDQLQQDFLNIVDGAVDLHFLGAIIIHGRRSSPANPKIFDVIDGQQRLTTLYLYLTAAVDQLIEMKQFDQAASLFLKYLAIGRSTSLPSNFKLHPCKEDRHQFNIVMENLLSDDNFLNHLGSFEPKYLPETGEKTGRLRSNYRLACRFFKDQFDAEGIERVEAIYTKIVEAVSVVQIDVQDPTNGPKIFDALNSRQEPMTIGDLVRNEIFSRVADMDPDQIEQIDQQYWQPFYRKFKQNGKNLFDSFFFPYGLIQKPNLKKSQVYRALREEWSEIREPKEIICQLETYQNAFIDIATGSNEEKHSSEIARCFYNLWSSNAPSSSYPFLMQLSKAIKDGKLSELEGKKILAVIESFLIRRAICGHEPTGLHAVFKKLWEDCDRDPTSEKVITEIKKHKTVVWPNDAATKSAILRRSLYGSRITRYVLLEYDKSLGGDQPKEVPWIEHVLPVNPDKEWYKKINKKQHKQYKDRIANLIPLTEEMNKSLSNKPYKNKRSCYLEDAMFKSTRQFAKKYEDWTPQMLKERGTQLGAWACERWLY